MIYINIQRNALINIGGDVLNKQTYDCWSISFVTSSYKLLALNQKLICEHTFIDRNYKNRHKT